MSGDKNVVESSKDESGIVESDHYSVCDVTTDDTAYLLMEMGYTVSMRALESSEIEVIVGGPGDVLGITTIQETLEMALCVISLKIQQMQAVEGVEGV